MRILVTGASGFIGKSICNCLRDQSHTVIELIHTPDTSTCPDRYVADIKQEAEIQKLRSIGRVDAVIHTAGVAHRMGGIPDEIYDQVNVTGSKNIASLASNLGARQLILLSSVLVYGRNKDGSLVSENTRCDPVDGYAKSKLEAEIAATRICEERGVGLTILRPSPVIGEGCKGNFVRLIKSIDRHRFIGIGKCVNRKSMVYVGDVALACLSILSLKTSLSPEIFNLAAPPITLREMCDAVCETLNRSRVWCGLPSGPPMTILKAINGIFSTERTVLLQKAIETWISDDVYCARSIEEKYGFVPSVSIRESVARTVRHLKIDSEKYMR